MTRLGLPDVEAMDAVPADRVPETLAHLAALQLRLVARLAGTPPVPVAVNGQNGYGGDHLLTAAEVHTRTTLSVDWLYRHGDALPFTHRIGRKVLFSARGLEKWLATRRRP
jgi:hypothetical protein